MNKLMLFQLVSPYHCGNQRNLRAILFALPDAFGTSLSQTDFYKTIKAKIFSSLALNLGFLYFRPELVIFKQHYIRGLLSVLLVFAPFE